MTIEELGALADRVLTLQKQFQEAFPSDDPDAHSKIAIMAGLKDSFNIGQRTDSKQLRELVDIVWRECTESDEVPSTEWADRIIQKWINPPINDEQ